MYPAFKNILVSLGYKVSMRKKKKTQSIDIRSVLLFKAAGHHDLGHIYNKKIKQKGSVTENLLWHV